MQPTLYTITPIAPRQIRIKPTRYKWNLAQPDAQSVINNPITTSGESLTFAAVAVLTRTDEGFDGHTYYLEEEQTPHGWDSADCELVVPAPMPEPHTPPSAPIPVTLADKYTVVAEVPSYSTSADAESSINKSGTLSAGEYFVFADDQGMKNLSPDNQHEGVWINPDENVVPAAPEPVKEPGPNNFISPRESSVVPEPVVVPPPEPPKPKVDNWKKTYRPFKNLSTGTEEPRSYVVNLPGRIWNLDETGEDVSILLKNKEHVQVYGTVVRDNLMHYRLKLKRDIHFDIWLCAPQIFDGRAVLTLPPTNFLERIFHKGLQLKSIFTETEPKYVDSVINPYKRGSK